MFKADGLSFNEHFKLSLSAALTPLKDYKEEFLSLQIKMEAEKEKAQMRDVMIEELRSDKLHLLQQVAQAEKLIKLQVEKEEKKVQQVKSGKNQFIKLREEC